jgi:D-alanyl-D-alanine carboxypeptidase
VNIIISLGLILSLLAFNGISIANPLSKLATKKQSSSKNQPFKPAAYTKQPTLKSGAKQYNAQAKEAIIYDTESGTVIYQKNTDEQTSIASTAKLFTALVIMQSHKPNEVVTVGNLPTLGAEDQKIGLVEGEEITVGELLKALLIYSANDAANALAIYDSGSIEKFADKMNNQAKTWGLNNSKFVEPSGLNAGDISSASDLAKIASILSTNETFKKITSTASTQISNLSGKTYNLTTTNKILGQAGVVGIKTGFTLEAGQCLVTAAERNGHRIITVVLDSPDRFQESKNMIEYAFNNYIWQ